MIRLLCALALLLLPAFAQAAPLIGVSPNIREGGSMNDLVSEITTLRKGGAQVMYCSYKWQDLEPKPGQYNLKDLINGVNGLGGMGFDLALTIQTLDTNNRTLPADLQNLPFDAPQVRERFDALLHAIAPKLTSRVRWVMLANEADGYLAEHPAELEPFAGFVERGRATLRSLLPGVAVGCTTMFGGLGAHPQMARRLNRAMDVVTLTYYPLDASFGVRPVSVVSGDMDAMVRAAGSKPLLLQEIGYPASPLLRSSDQKQAQFVDAVFDALAKHRSKVACANFFLLCDFNDKLLDQLLAYYRLPSPRFRAYLATLGLKRANGTPRPAWTRFLSRLKRWNEAAR